MGFSGCVLHWILFIKLKYIDSARMTERHESMAYLQVFRASVKTGLKSAKPTNRNVTGILCVILYKSDLRGLQPSPLPPQCEAVEDKRWAVFKGLVHQDKSIIEVRLQRSSVTSG